MFTETNEIRIETSTLCNYNCIMCARKSFKRKQETMSNDLFDLIIEKAKNELPDIEVITISGFGEFSTDKNWRHKVEKGSREFNKVHIVTNLSVLNEPDIDFLMDNISDIRISVYGFDNGVYQTIHNHPSSVNYQIIRDRILYLNDKKKNGQITILNYIETPENRHQTREWIRYWEDRVDLIEVWQPHNWIDAHNYRFVCEHRMATCGRLFNGPIQVQVDGTVNVCCFDYNGEIVIGDLKKQKFAEIFNGKEMTRVQELHSSGQADRIRLCSICDQRNCAECKSLNVLYNSGFDVRERVGATSTEYDSLLE